jgi:vacuolar-type H+-ATPase subunit F/Vma7
MADIVMIVPPDFEAGFLLAGARVLAAADASTARALLMEALADPDAGVVGYADIFDGALSAADRRSIERRYRPVVVPVPTSPTRTPEESRRAYVLELIRQAIGYRVVLGHGTEETER